MYTSGPYADPNYLQMAIGAYLTPSASGYKCVDPYFLSQGNQHYELLMEAVTIIKFLKINLNEIINFDVRIRSFRTKTHRTTFSRSFFRLPRQRMPCPWDTRNRNGYERSETLPPPKGSNRFQRPSADRLGKALWGPKVHIVEFFLSIWLILVPLNRYLSTPERVELASALGLSETQVKTWFQVRQIKSMLKNLKKENFRQNRRMKHKKQLRRKDAVGATNGQGKLDSSFLLDEIIWQ